MNSKLIYKWKVELRHLKMFKIMIYTKFNKILKENLQLLEISNLKLKQGIFF